MTIDKKWLDDSQRKIVLDRIGLFRAWHGAENDNYHLHYFMQNDASIKYLIGVILSANSREDAERLLTSVLTAEQQTICRDGIRNIIECYDLGCPICGVSRDVTKPRCSCDGH